MQNLLSNMLIACVTIALVATGSNLACATIPFGSTVVEHVKGEWRLRNGYANGQRILILDESGKTVLNLPIREALSRRDYNTFVRETTAGPHWGELAVSYFITLEGAPHFCIRTWWGGRILLNLGDAKQVSAKGYKRQLKARETEVILQHLRNGVAGIPTWKDTYLESDLPYYVRAGAHLAGLIQLKQAVPLLQQLEQVEGFDSSISGGEKLDSYELNETRRIVQLALRRLGAAPETSSPILLDFAEDLPGVPLKVRHEQAPHLNVGMSPLEILQLIGAPDYIEWLGHRGTGWRYDIDAESPYTLMITWKDQTAVEGIDRFSPALSRYSLSPDSESVISSFEADGSSRLIKPLYTGRFRGTLKQVR